MSEVLRSRYDRNNTLPRESRQRARGPEGPSVWHARPSADFPIAETYGRYPKGWLPWACRVLGCARSDVVHLCSGALGAGEGALRIDLRADVRPDIVADCTRLPLRESFAAAVMIDPPYTVEYAADLYGCDYPRPSHLLREAERIALPGAPIGFLHFLVPKSAPGLAIEAVYGVTTGPNYRIRAFTVLRKRAPELDLRSADPRGAGI